MLKVVDRQIETDMYRQYIKIDRYIHSLVISLRQIDEQLVRSLRQIDIQMDGQKDSIQREICMDRYKDTERYIDRQLDLLDRQMDRQKDSIQRDMYGQI